MYSPREIGAKNGNPPVGALISYNSKIIGEGIESGKTSGDITDHAEIMAVRDAITLGNADLLPSATLYTTHEPCLMCAYLIRHHQIPLLVYGVPVDFIGGDTSQFKVLSTEEVPNWKVKPRIIKGILMAECESLNKSFAKLTKDKQTRDI